MNRAASTIVTTACVGMAVGTAAYMMSGNRAARGNVRRLKKSAGRALRQAGEFIESVSCMIK